MDKQITVRDLMQLCLMEIKKGNGDKKIILSDDEEGNGFHGLYCGFTPSKGFEGLIYDSDDLDHIEKLIVLG